MAENLKFEQEPKEGGIGKKLIFWVGAGFIALSTILALWGKEALSNKTSAVDEFKARGTVAEANEPGSKATSQSIKEVFSKGDANRIDALPTEAEMADIKARLRALDPEIWRVFRPTWITRLPRPYFSVEEKAIDDQVHMCNAQEYPCPPKTMRAHIFHRSRIMQEEYEVGDDFYPTSEISDSKHIEAYNKSAAVLERVHP